MMLGSTMAGLAFGTAGTAAAHAIQYPVGALTHTAHGLGVAAILPYVMAYNRPACEAGFAAIGTAIGLPAEGSRSEQAEAAITGVVALFARIGIPADLKALGVREENLDEIGRLALGAERLIKNNPRPLTPDSMALLVRAAFDGRRDALAGQGAPA
jgi:alcohol dehydrogenase